jgi:nitroreductase
MDVYEAVASRRAVREFTDRAVERSVLERVLAAAVRAPSGANLQPWHSYLVTGAPLTRLKRRIRDRVTEGDPGDEREYRMYPAELGSPYRERRARTAQQRYHALGVDRTDTDARNRAVARNWEAFGAPALLLCYLDADLAEAQWVDLGIYLQTVLLLLRAEGLHSCPQLAWSVYRQTVAEIVEPPRRRILVCGVSIGYADLDEDGARTERAPLTENLTWIDS